MDKFIPATGETGFYRVAHPFEITEGEVYTCKAIRTISEFISLGVDPYEQYYKPFNIELDIFESHVTLDMEIISLQNDGGRWVHIPASYMLGYPNMNGIPYRSVAITVMLPPFPVDQTYTHVESQVKDIVQEALGVNATSKLVVVSKTKLIDSGAHEVTKASRIQASKGSTPTAQAAYWKNAYEALKVRHDALIESME